MLHGQWRRKTLNFYKRFLYVLKDCPNQTGAKAAKQHMAQFIRSNRELDGDDARRGLYYLRCVVYVAIDRALCK